MEGTVTFCRKRKIWLDKGCTPQLHVGSRHGILIAVNCWFELLCIVNMPSSVCPCTLLELHVGSPGQQPTGAISAHVMVLTHKPSFGRSVSQKKKKCYFSSWREGLALYKGL